MITVKEFDRLSRRDFENGAVISGIRSQLKQDAERIRELEEELKAVKKERDAYKLAALVAKRVREGVWGE